LYRMLLPSLIAWSNWALVHCLDLSPSRMNQNGPVGFFGGIDISTD
jgi:hypothetical protein